MNYLSREEAPFDNGLWERIDEEARSAATDLLTVRRFLEIDGPYGVGLTSIETGNDAFCRTPGPGEAAAIGGRALAVPMLRKQFGLSIRRLAAASDMGQPLNLSPVGEAAEAVARREEEILYKGQPEFDLPGLLTVKGAQELASASWEDLDMALQAVLGGVNALDQKGFRGPYALALAPHLYNGLFRRYAGTDMLQVEHLSRLCKAGVYKAPIEGALLVDRRAARIVLGQDLMSGYIGQDGVHCDLFLSESLALVIDDPQAICIMNPPAPTAPKINVTTK